MRIEVPEAPRALKVLDKSGRLVQLSWSAPYDGNSPIIRYLIEYKVAKGKDIPYYITYQFLFIVVRYQAAIFLFLNLI